MRVDRNGVLCGVGGVALVLMIVLLLWSPRVEGSVGPGHSGFVAECASIADAGFTGVITDSSGLRRAEGVESVEGPRAWEGAATVCANRRAAHLTGIAFLAVPASAL